MSSERVVDLLNNAALSRDAGEKLRQLRVVQEILIHQEPNLLDNFLDEVMGFQKDRSQDVRKFVVGFIEEACQRDPETLAKVIANLQMMMSDGAVVIQKRVIQAMSQLYKVALVWLAQAKSLSEDMEAVWTVVCGIKSIITHLLEADNDGIRTHTVKFMEMLVITQTHKEAQSQGKPNEFSLDEVPLNLKIVKRRKLEEEAKLVFEEIVKYHKSDHISSANLMTCMGALTNIAKSRPQFMAKVITALETLHANLPPTLARSQVSSVRKHLKNQLLALLKHPVAAENYFTNITTLLTDLGASRDEVMKAMPRFEEMRRKVKRAQEKAAATAASGETQAKRGKLQKDEDEEDDDDEDEDDEDMEERAAAQQRAASKYSHSQVESAVDITEKFIMERLDSDLATELVIRSMHLLPVELPPQFHNTYTPIAAAGTEGQVKHVSRLLATQLTSAHLGPGIVALREKQLSEAQTDPHEDEEESGASKTISVIGDRPALPVERAKPVTLMPAGMSKKSTRVRTVRLADMTTPLSPEEKTHLLSGALKRILNAERTAKMGGVCPKRIKIIGSLVSQCPKELKLMVLKFIFEDVKGRTDLAFAWLFEEYCFFQGFNKTSTLYNKRNDDTEYNSLLCGLIKSAIAYTHGLEREELLRRLYLEPPIITEDSIDLLKSFILMEDTAITVVHLMKDLVMRRPTKKLNFLNFLLEFCSHNSASVRETANQTVLQLHGNGDYNDIIEDYSIMYLRFLLSPSPPSMLYGDDRGRPSASETWSDDIIRVCLYLYLSLLPRNLKLFMHLAEVYVAANGDIKRTILRVLDTPVKSIDMTNPDLLDLIENCPKGSETLVTRIVHILTETNKPTPELVEKVRDLYEQRVSDVRFLIPVLNGLSKNEIVSALPKLIKLNPVVVKEVFNRLLSVANGPMSPADLLIALHLVDPHKCDTKSVIGATALCFQDRKTYSQETLAIVLQQLMERPIIPLLFMRTVIQAVKMYPRLIGFVMNILQRLIVKQVWKQRQIWDGFIKCCERTVPQSYAVMLQLPPPQLAALLDVAPALRDPLLVHVQDFTDDQRQHITAKTMAVLYNETLKHELKEEKESAMEKAPVAESTAEAPFLERKGEAVKDE